MRTVVVLGGGGAKALAHVGAWRALEEAGINPVAVVGSSMGAVLGAALAAGLSAEEVRERLDAVGESRIVIPNPLSFVAGLFSDGLLLASPLRELIRRLVPTDSFDNLKIPCLVAITDLQMGKLVLCGARAVAAEHPEVTDGFPLRLSLEASCALPLYYEPVVIYGRRYADGGLRAVLPIEAARLFAPDLVLALHTGPGFDDIPSPAAGGNIPIPTVVRAHGEALRILMAEQSERAIAAWPAAGPNLLVVRAVNETEATFAGGSGERYLALGYEATKRALRERTAKGEL